MPKTLFIIVLLCLAVAGLVLFWPGSSSVDEEGQSTVETSEVSLPAQQAETVPTPVAEPRDAPEVGSAGGSQSAIGPSVASVVNATKDEVRSDGAGLFPAVGRTPPIDPNANPEVRSVVEAIEKGAHPERLSSLVAPEPFDEEAYRADPAAWERVIQPGAIFQRAQPGPDVTAIQRLGPAEYHVDQNESVRLSVQVGPGDPVVFQSLDLAQLSSGLTTDNVIASGVGVASTVFTAPAGTYDRVRVLASSPVCSNQAVFSIIVQWDEGEFAAGSVSDPDEANQVPQP